MIDFLPQSLSSLRGLPQYFQPPPSLPSVPSLPTSEPAPETVDNPAQPLPPTYVCGKPNAFGLYRSYLEVPKHDPEAEQSLESVCDAPTLATAKSQRSPWWSVFGAAKSSIRRAAESHFTPFLNMTTFRLMAWFYSGSSMKSLGELDRLVKDVIMAPDFNRDELKQFSASREGQRVDDWIDEDSAASKDFQIEDGWHEASVKIRVPCERSKWPTEQDAPLFDVPGVFYRKLMDIIKTTLASATAQTFHMVPFKLWLHPSGAAAGDPDKRVYSELYNSDAMNDEYEKIKSTPRPDGCKLETVVAGLMLWSDSTHLAQFGNASLWPIYAFFGNQSKYVRCKPTEFAAHHLAYIPSVSG